MNRLLSTVYLLLYAISRTRGDEPQHGLPTHYPMLKTIPYMPEEISA
ncbi:MAG: hypothetical protein NZ661_11700 [Candidatus Kapabacteria bacterium]|nr:hypothetical protein [Candidatus Kapabacteria bacterium]